MCIARGTVRSKIYMTLVPLVASGSGQIACGSQSIIDYQFKKLHVDRCLEKCGTAVGHPAFRNLGLYVACCVSDWISSECW